MLDKILNLLAEDFPWRDCIQYSPTIDSTNTRAKALAAEGAPEGTILIAGQQTGGRGRMGKAFQSPADMGVYLSVILRPDCPPKDLMHLTCAAGIHMCDAVYACSGFQAGIKWTNDLVAGKRKLGGILTEMSVNSVTGLTDYAVVGIGINCLQRPEDFPPELQDMATSLSCAAGKAVSQEQLAASMIQALYTMRKGLFTEKQATMERYKKLCITIGQPISLLRGQQVSYGKAIDLDGEGGLIVRFQDGTEGSVTSGEVSVRGMYGYI